MLAITHGLVIGEADANRQEPWHRQWQLPWVGTCLCSSEQEQGPQSFHIH